MQLELYRKQDGKFAFAKILTRSQVDSLRVFSNLLVDEAIGVSTHSKPVDIVAHGRPFVLPLLLFLFPGLRHWSGSNSTGGQLPKQKHHFFSWVKGIHLETCTKDVVIGEFVTAPQASVWLLTTTSANPDDFHFLSRNKIIMIMIN